MSAFVVDKAHIDALVRLAHEGPADRAPGPYAWYSLVTDQLHEPHNTALRLRAYGATLWRENLRSVNYRYNERTPLTLVSDYDYTGGRRLTLVEGLKAISGLEYQSCERPDWEKSEAYRLLNALRAQLCQHIIGYDEATTYTISDRAYA